VRDKFPTRTDPIPCYPASTIFELIVAAFRIKLAFNHSGCAWRGHAVASWTLESTLHRRVRVEGRLERRWESTLINEFVAQAPSREPNLPPLADRAKWLVVMRHHGLPVRLLDWTWNPLAAAYFAVAGFAGDDALMWALEPTLFNTSQGWGGGLGSLYSGDSEIKPLVDGPFALSQPIPDRVLAVAAPEATRRIAAQQGLFTIHGSAEPIESLPNKSKFLACIAIPASAKEGILKDLDALGISRKHLFPDLDSLAHDLANALRTTAPTSP